MFPRPAFLLAFGLALWCSGWGCHAWALEVSEVSVDFPLSQVLGSSGEGGEGNTVQGVTAPEPSFPRASWEEEWFAYRSKAVKGQLPSALPHLQKIHRFRLERGIPNLFLPAAALVQEASQARKESRFEDALTLLDHARKLAPQDPSPLFQKARVLWERNRLRVLSSLDALIEGWSVTAGDFRSLFPALANTVLWVLGGLLLAGMLLLASFGLLAIRRVSHDLSHLVPLPAWVYALLIPLVLFLAFLLGVGFFPVLLALALIPLAHYTPRERAGVVIGALLLTALPLLVQVLAVSQSFYSRPPVLTLYEVERGGNGNASLLQLEKLRAADPRNPRILSLLGLVLKREGRYPEAERLLAEAAGLAPDSAVIANNLGNVFMAQGKLEDAIQQFRAALRLQDLAMIHYNLSQALRTNLQLDEGNREFDLAQSLDPDQVGYYMTMPVEEGAPRPTADLLHGMGGDLAASLRVDPEGVRWREGLWAGIVPRIPFRVAFLLFPLASALLLAGAFLPPAVDPSRSCPRCGRLHCARCGRPNKENLCPQCHQIFLVRSGVEPASRVKKMMQVMHFKKRRTVGAVAGTILFPGLGHAFLGQGWQAALFAALSGLFWSRWIFWDGVFRSQTMLSSGGGYLSRGVFAACFALFAFLVLRSAGKKLEG